MTSGTLNYAAPVEPVIVRPLPDGGVTVVVPAEPRRERAARVVLMLLLAPPLAVAFSVLQPFDLLVHPAQATAYRIGCLAMLLFAAVVWLFAIFEAPSARPAVVTIDATGIDAVEPTERTVRVSRRKLRAINLRRDESGRPCRVELWLDGQVVHVGCGRTVGDVNEIFSALVAAERATRGPDDPAATICGADGMPDT